MDLNPSRQQVRQLRRDNRAWPEELTEVPYDQWPPTPPKMRRPIGVYRSRHFLMQVFEEGNGILRLSVNRTDWNFTLGRFREDISWDDLQRLKTEAGFGDRWAVEVFPADDEVVNVANMRHLWLMKGAPTFAWRKSPAQGEHP